MLILANSRFTVTSTSQKLHLEFSFSLTRPVFLEEVVPTILKPCVTGYLVIYYPGSLLPFISPWSAHPSHSFSPLSFLSELQSPPLRNGHYADPGDAGLGDVNSGDTNPEDADPGDANPGDADPRDAYPGDASLPKCTQD